MKSECFKTGLKILISIKEKKILDLQTRIKIKRNFYNKNQLNDEIKKVEEEIKEIREKIFILENGT